MLSRSQPSQPQALAYGAALHQACLLMGRLNAAACLQLQHQSEGHRWLADRGHDEAHPGWWGMCTVPGLHH